nr:AmmeMemoRadiSam system radical SAM enzyme [Desulfobulbaceae bacterium]
MKEASFYHVIDSSTSTVQCDLCSHRCIIKIGKKGICNVRLNINGTLHSLVYGKLVSECSDPIEKKPLFHVLPGSLSYSIATVGCNFKCSHCQNHQISQYPITTPDSVPGTLRTPSQVVDIASSQGCKSISYTYIEPTIFFEFAIETAELAHQKGLKNIFVSNGYTSPEATIKIAPFLDANNIDLKSFSDKFYQQICKAKLAPVLDTISLMKERGVWIEVTTLIIPGLNDSDAELGEIAKFLVGLDPEIPWHVSRFHPTYKLTTSPPTPPESLYRAKEIGHAAGLKYVYTGNIHGMGGEDTFCPECHKTVVKRSGYTIEKNCITDGKCPKCNSPIAGLW